jgi:hypothetical protein
MMIARRRLRRVGEAKVFCFSNEKWPGGGMRILPCFYILFVGFPFLDWDGFGP